MLTKSFRLFNLSLLILLMNGLSGCGSNNDDLKDFIETTKAKPGGMIEPLPELTPPEVFIYSASGLRSPFVKPIREETGGGNKTEAPNEDRVKEVLESFNIDQLVMVGTLQNENSTLWALVSDGAKGVYRVGEGNYLGRNHGKVVKIYLDKIDVVEVVTDGRGGWLERPKTLMLKEK
jgi:type IV pilus assembly protein PilP